jgi:MYXO-CTERM domain-containing protein
MPDGVASCQPQVDCVSSVALFSGNTGGGCQCGAVPGAPAPGALAALVGLLALRARRRKR